MDEAKGETIQKREYEERRNIGDLLKALGMKGLVMK